MKKIKDLKLYVVIFHIFYNHLITQFDKRHLTLTV
jgi:hypothetical protein